MTHQPRSSSLALGSLAVGAALFAPAPALAGSTATPGSTAESSSAGSYYVAPSSYSTTRDPDPPKYVTPLNQSTIGEWAALDWLDVGLDYRGRYEYRDGDLRRSRDEVDHPYLQRVRGYLGVREILDPFRFALEFQDSRRFNSDFPDDNRDLNELDLIRLYGELYFDAALGHDPKDNPRPLSLRYGIHNFEFLDRRLIGNNQWRNTANSFQGFHGTLGQEKNDWQLDLLAVQPRDRLMREFDEPIDDQWFYAAIGHWRGWSEVITLEPFYLVLDQGANADSGSREIHSPGLRGYGNIGETGFDYDFSAIAQFGESGEEDHRAWAGTLEVGYKFDHAWKPRASLFYGYASGDEDPQDAESNRFERFFGFGRPWSANDYIVFENISTPKARLEFQPHDDWRIDLGYSFFWLASDTDRFSAANNARDADGESGSFLGHEFDIRARYNLGKQTDFAIGYSHFTPGEFTRNTVRGGGTDFFYIEFTRRFF